jgi:hypothetical protein
MNFRSIDEYGFKRINSEAEAYQFIRRMLKKQRLSPKTTRSDKRCIFVGQLKDVTVGAYYLIESKPYATFVTICGTNALTHLVDKAKDLLYGLCNKGVPFTEVRDALDFCKYVISGDNSYSIEDKCDIYLLMYFALGGELAPAKRLFGSIADNSLKYSPFVEV